MNCLKERKGLLSVYPQFCQLLAVTNQPAPGPHCDMGCEEEDVLFYDLKISKHNPPLTGSSAFLHHLTEYQSPDAWACGLLQPIDPSCFQAALAWLLLLLQETL